MKGGGSPEGIIGVLVEYYHQCQRGRLLEMLSLMEKEKKGAAPELSLWQKNKEEPAIRQRRQTKSRGSKGSKKRQLRQQMKQRQQIEIQATDEAKVAN